MSSKKYFTYLHPKTLNIRNNVKSAMIQELLFNLHGSMDTTNNSISSIYNVPFFTMIQLFKPLDCLKYSKDDIPCMNTDCEWIQHMLLFYSSHDLFLLPGLIPDGYCKLCHMAKSKTLNRSKIRLAPDKVVQILE
jgi:hypothetical protein